MPTIHASGGPRSAIASTRERSAGVAHSAVAATAAEYETRSRIPSATCASDQHGKSARRAETSEPSASVADAAEEKPSQPDTRRQQPRRERRDARPRAPRPSASCPAVAIETPRSRATSGKQRIQDDERGLRRRQRGEERDADGARTVPHQRMIGTVPPSALHAAPVTYDARSEQRNTIDRGDLVRIARAVRAAVPRRPSRAPPRGRPAGRRARPRRAMRPSRSGPGSPRCSGSRPSRTGPRRGARARARRPSSPSSAACPVDGRLPAVDETLTIAPPPSRRCGRAARIART